MDKFECKMCGNCCKSFISQSDPDIKVPSFLGTLIILNKPRLLLNIWEKDLFPKENVVPCYVVYDSLNKQTIILDYTLNTNSCHLLKNNECTIYEKRPIACREFPCPYGSDPRGVRGTGCSFGHCSAELPHDELHKKLGFELSNKEAKINAKTLSKNLYLRYGDAYLNKIILENISLFKAHMLMALQEEGRIYLEQNENVSLNEIMPKIKESNKIKLSEVIKKEFDLDFKIEVDKIISVTRSILLESITS